MLVLETIEENLGRSSDKNILTSFVVKTIKKTITGQIEILKKIQQSLNILNPKIK